MFRLLKLFGLVVVGLVACIILIGVADSIVPIPAPSNNPQGTKTEAKDAAKRYIRKDWSHLPSNTFTHRHNVVFDKQTKNTWRVLLWVDGQHVPKWDMIIAKNNRWELIALKVDGNEVYRDNSVKIVYTKESGIIDRYNP